MDLKDGWIKNDFNGLESSRFYNHFALAIKDVHL
jgi:hypothetical protein